MPEIRNKQQAHIEFKDIPPYWKPVLKELHSRGIPYCYATQEDLRKALNAVKRKKKKTTIT